MNLMCLIGWHDYEVLSTIPESHLRARIVAGLNTSKYDIDYLGQLVFEHKICLRCGKIVDEITQKIKESEQAFLYRKTRREQAGALLYKITKEKDVDIED